MLCFERANFSCGAGEGVSGGSGGWGADTTQMIGDQAPETEPDTPSPITECPGTPRSAGIGLLVQPGASP